MRKYIIGLTACFLMCSVMSWAAAPSRLNVYTSGELITASDVTENEDAIFNYLNAGVEVIKDNVVVNADLSSSANVQASKLNLTSINQSIANTGTLTNTGNVTVTGDVAISSDISGTGLVVTTHLQNSAMKNCGTVSTDNGGTFKCNSGGDLVLENLERISNATDDEVQILDDDGTTTYMSVDGTNNNSFFGLSAGEGNSGGVNNVAIGLNALKVNNDGSINVAIGDGSLIANNDGSGNIAIGEDALAANTDGSANIAIGSGALEDNVTGGGNIAIGTDTIKANTSGTKNIAIGKQDALLKNTEGTSNISIGEDSLDSNTTGNVNVGIGEDALGDNIDGSGNVAVGDDAAAGLTSPDNSVYIGKEVRGSSSTESNAIVIGYQAAGKGSNTVVIGNTNVTDNYFTGAIHGTGLVVSVSIQDTSLSGAYSNGEATLCVDNSGTITVRDGGCN